MPEGTAVFALALFCAILVAALMRLYILAARAIRRDVEQRFERIQAGLEEQANAVVDELLRRDGRS